MWHFYKAFNNRKTPAALVSIILFFSAFPVISRISFPKNDDWVYYRMVEAFLKGDFTLDSISAPTFYTQGLLGSVFSLIFGIDRLPVLTLAVTLASFFVMNVILLRFFRRGVFTALILSLLFIFNPLVVYSSLGFMSENYFLLFFLLALYFFLRFENGGTYKDFLLFNIFVIFGFFVRQVALVLPLASCLYFLANRKLKFFWYELLVFAGLLGYYYLLFPATDEMREKGLEFAHLAEFDYSFSLIYAILIYMGALLLPLFITAVPFSQFKKAWKVLLFLFVTAVLYFGLEALFSPQKLAWGEFPYLDNTWERRGFYPRGIGGTKYYFYGIYDLYKYWEIFAKVAVAVFLTSMAFRGKKVLNIFSLTAISYLGLMVVTQKTYDRYLTVLIPLFIFLLTSLRVKFYLWQKSLLGLFVLFLGFYSYQLSMDFLKVNEYVWGKSVVIAQTGVDKNLIQGTNAWKLMNFNPEQFYLYDFSYDSPKVNQVYAEYYRLVEAKEIDYPLNFFIDSKVYLYERINYVGDTYAAL